VRAKLDLHGLDLLLEGYGISMNKDLVLDLTHAARLVLSTSTGNANVDLPSVLDVHDAPRLQGNEAFIDTRFPGLRNVEDVAVPFASSLTIHADRQPGARVTVVMRSSPSAVHLEDETVSLKPMQKWGLRLQGLVQHQFDVAATVEGTLGTAFRGGDAQGADAPATSRKPARVLVVASSQFLANPLARAGNGPDVGQLGAMMPNVGDDEQLLMLAGPYAQQFTTASILVFKNTLDWMLDTGWSGCLPPPGHASGVVPTSH